MLAHSGQDVCRFGVVRRIEEEVGAETEPLRFTSAASAEFVPGSLRIGEWQVDMDTSRPRVSG